LDFYIVDVFSRGKYTGNQLAVFMENQEVSSEEMQTVAKEMNFADYYGIPEDTATGSSNECLAAYLLKYRYFGTEKVDMRVEQGYEINRPSLIHIQAEKVASKINVSVGGKVESIASGKWIVSYHKGE